MIVPPSGGRTFFPLLPLHRATVKNGMGTLVSFQVTFFDEDTTPSNNRGYFTLVDADHFVEPPSATTWTGGASATYAHEPDSLRVAVHAERLQDAGPVVRHAMGSRHQSQPCDRQRLAQREADARHARRSGNGTDREEGRLRRGIEWCPGLEASRQRLRRLSADADRRPLRPRGSNQRHRAQRVRRSRERQLHFTGHRRGQRGTDFQEGDDGRGLHD